jgi:hypothetical protein
MNSVSHYEDVVIARERIFEHIPFHDIDTSPFR